MGASTDADRLTRVLLAAYALLYLGPFAWAAVTWDGFWSSVAPFSSLLALALLVALLRQHGWAWTVLVLLHVIALASYLWDEGDAIALVMIAGGLLILLAAPIRRYARISQPRGSVAQR